MPPDRQQKTAVVAEHQQVVEVGLDDVDILIAVHGNALGPYEIADVQPTASIGTNRFAAQRQALHPGVQSVGDV